MTCKPEDKNNKCDTCENCALVDNGYSNYTVMGTDVHCMVYAHPGTPFDLWYGEDWRLEFARFCHSYKEGEPARFDVEIHESDLEHFRRGDLYWYVKNIGEQYGWRDEVARLLPDA